MVVATLVCHPITKQTNRIVYLMAKPILTQQIPESICANKTQPNLPHCIKSFCCWDSAVSFIQQNFIEGGEHDFRGLGITALEAIKKEISPSSLQKLSTVELIVKPIVGISLQQCVKGSCKHQTFVRGHYYRTCDTEPLWVEQWKHLHQVFILHVSITHQSLLVTQLSLILIV